MDNIIVKPVITTDVPNRNGRIYPQDVVKQAMDEFSKRLPVLGEFEQSQSLTINMDRISHTIEEVYMEGDDMMACIKVLDTPMGNILNQLRSAGVEVFPQSRGSGRVDENGVVLDFSISTIDVGSNNSRIPKEDANVKFDRVMNDLVKKDLL